MDKAGYKRERTYVWERYGRRIATCHVAHVKESLGLTRGPARNRSRLNLRSKPCPPELWDLVAEAVRHVHGA